jgi:hypothetical protein
MSKHKMTAEKLIEILKLLPPDTEIICIDGIDRGYQSYYGESDCEVPEEGEMKTDVEYGCGVSIDSKHMFLEQPYHAEGKNGFLSHPARLTIGKLA